MTRREFDALTKERHDGSPDWGPDGALAYAARRCRRWRLDPLALRAATSRLRPGEAILARGTFARLDAERSVREGLPLLTWPGAGVTLAEAWAPLPLPEPRPVVEVRHAA